MINKLVCLTDYKNIFGSKWKASPYRSGYDKKYLADLFISENYELEFLSFSDVDYAKKWDRQIVLYSSSEEYGLHYKNFIEDIILGLKEAGALLIPDPHFLRANNNKVFMEILRKLKIPGKLQTIDSFIFGTYDEALAALANGKILPPCVVKTAEGAMSRGVFLARNANEFKKVAKRISSTFDLKVYLQEFMRAKKHKGYKTESMYQRKFIVQPFIEGLTNDWKVLIYGGKYFVLRRNIRKNDFRASGSHYNYVSGSASGFPDHMFPLLKSFFEALDVPNLSIDFAFDGEIGYIFEFQAIYFGTSTQYKSKEYYEYIDGVWKVMPNIYDQEQVYVQSIIEFLNSKNA